MNLIFFQRMNYHPFRRLLHFLNRTLPNNGNTFFFNFLIFSTNGKKKNIFKFFFHTLQFFNFFFQNLFSTNKQSQKGHSHVMSFRLGMVSLLLIFHLRQSELNAFVLEHHFYKFSKTTEIDSCLKPNL